LIITLAVPDGFLYFLYQWKQEGILSKQVNKIYHFTLNCLSTLPGKTKITYKQHILKSITTVRSIEPVVDNFRRKSSNVRIFPFLVESSFISLLAGRKTFTFSGFYKKIRVILKLNIGPI